MIPVEHSAFVAITLTPANQVIHPSIMHGLFKDWKEGDVYDKPPLFYQNTTAETAATMDKVSDEIQVIAHALSKQLNTEIVVPKIDDMMRDFYGDGEFSSLVVVGVFLLVLSFRIS